MSSWWQNTVCSCHCRVMNRRFCLFMLWLLMDASLLLAFVSFTTCMEGRRNCPVCHPKIVHTLSEIIASPAIAQQTLQKGSPLYQGKIMFIYLFHAAKIKQFICCTNSKCDTRHWISSTFFQGQFNFEGCSNEPDACIDKGQYCLGQSKSLSGTKCNSGGNSVRSSTGSNFCSCKCLCSNHNHDEFPPPDCNIYSVCK